MKLHRYMILLAGCTALLACAQQETQPQQVTNTDDHEEIEADRAVLAKELEAMRIYASLIEKQYAEQEAEIGALRKEVGRLRSQENESE